MKTRLHSRCLFVHGWQEERGRGALVSGSSRNKLPRTGRLVTTAVYSLAVPEVRSPEAGSQPGQAPREGSREGPSPALPAPASRLLACGRVAPIPAAASAWPPASRCPRLCLGPPFVFLTRTPAVGFGVRP